MEKKYRTRLLKKLSGTFALCQCAWNVTSVIKLQDPALLYRYISLNYTALKSEKLTFWVFVGKPVVFSVLVFKVGVALLTLLCSEVLKVFGAIINVTQLVLIVHPWTVLTSIRWTNRQKIIIKYRSTKYFKYTTMWSKKQSVTKVNLNKV